MQILCITSLSQCGILLSATIFLQAQAEPAVLDPSTGPKFVFIRGGSYHCPPHLIRSAYRAADNPEKAYSVLGFRLIAEIKQQTK